MAQQIQGADDLDTLLRAVRNAAPGRQNGRLQPDATPNPNPNEITQVPPVGPGTGVAPSIFGTLADKSQQFGRNPFAEGSGFAAYQIPWFLANPQAKSLQWMPDSIKNKLFRGLGWRGKTAAVAAPTALHWAEAVHQANPFGRFGEHEPQTAEAERRVGEGVEAGLWELGGAAAGGALDTGPAVWRRGKDAARRYREGRQTTGEGSRIFGGLRDILSGKNRPTTSGRAQTRKRDTADRTPDADTPTPDAAPKDVKRPQTGATILDINQPSSTRRRGRADTTKEKTPQFKTPTWVKSDQGIRDTVTQIVDMKLEVGGRGAASRALKEIAQTKEGREKLLAEAERIGGPKFADEVQAYIRTTMEKATRQFERTTRRRNRANQ